MCCDGFDNGPIVKDKECPDCGGEVNEDGEAAYGCNYSPVACETCGARPCDGSC